MTKAFQSSGDMIADRRAGFARLLSEEGDHHAAAEVMAQTLELAPDWAGGWDLLGTYCEKAGDVSGAISAWRHLEALDDEGVFGTALKLSAHGAAVAAAGTAVSYVEALFDQYAPRFEASLVGKLGYQVPELLDAMIEQEMARQGIGRWTLALDLGCGTGLMGERLRGKVERLDGVDLSAAMVATARRKNIYDQLEKDELVRFLQRRPIEADLITAADVLIYCGALPPVLNAMVGALKPGGLLAFSLEAHEGEEPMFLRPSLRYAHGVAATRVALADAGLHVCQFETATLRQDRGAPIAGMLVVAQKPDPAQLEDEA
ncbi:MULTISPECIES: methyltransferase [unclassified Devosia]|uniref:class I SAM-dependent DNA methyltransferase n=1 Tax=unclassified Devosia TaxID=196773 RepID=UPI0020BF1ABA|nr:MULTISPECIES: methyltransferase [unclassified Devosia]